MGIESIKQSLRVVAEIEVPVLQTHNNKVYSEAQKIQIQKQI
jgi:hypothetical protein